MRWEKKFRPNLALNEREMILLDIFCHLMPKLSGVIHTTDFDGSHPKFFCLYLRYSMNRIALPVTLSSLRYDYNR